MTDSCEFGKIAEINNDYYKIVLDQDTSCRSCGMNQLCSEKEILIDRTDVNEDFKINQRVRLTFEKVIQTSFLLYLLPLFFFFAGIVFSQTIITVSSELVIFIIALLSMAISFGLIRLFSNNFNRDEYKIKVKSVNTMNPSILSTGGNHAG